MHSLTRRVALCFTLRWFRYNEDLLKLQTFTQSTLRSAINGLLPSPPSAVLTDRFNQHHRAQSLLFLSDKSAKRNEISLRRVTLTAIWRSNYWIKCHSCLSRVLEWKIKVGKVQVSTLNLCSCRDKSTIIKCSCWWVKFSLLLPLFFIYFLMFNSFFM